MPFVLAVVVKNLNVVVENRMIVILKRIPSNTRKTDIINHLTPSIKGKIFQKSGFIESVEIKALKDPQTKTMEHHAIVVISCDEVALRVIKKLNRKVFKRKNIAVTKYHHRSWKNDPRKYQFEMDKKIKLKRKFDRRRYNLKNARTPEISYVSYDGFHRKL